METGSEGESDRNNNGETEGSKKRKRQMKTPFQQEMLEKTYALEMHPVKDTIEKLSKTLGLTDSQLQLWFRKRRLKDKKVRTAKRAKGGGEIGSSRSSSRLKDMNQKTMGKPDGLNFEVGQLAETKTFETGFRSAWFRCKIKDIRLKENKILPEYYDFPDEKIKWANIYETPPYGRSKKIEKQLMVRPQYPQMYQKSEMPPVGSISEVCVVIDDAWKIGDLVDWHEKDCYWSASITYILSDDMVKIALPKPPTGQGKIYKVFCKDLRPSLDWSPSKGWTLPTVRGRTCSAQLIFPSPQGMDSEREKIASPVNASSTSRTSVILSAAPIEKPLQSQEVEIDGLHLLGMDSEREKIASPVNASSTSRTSVILSAAPIEKPLQSQEVEIDGLHLLGMDSEREKIASPVNASSTSRTSVILSAAPIGKPLQSQEVEVDGDDVEKASSADSISTMRVEESKTDDAAWDNVDHNIIDLNIMHEDTLEASILDLEELANRIKWLRGILENNQSRSRSWKFEELSLTPSA